MAVSARTRVRGGEAVVGALKAHGVDTVFGIPGVHNLEIYDALVDEPGITNILARHEQGVGFMADGYARATGKPGVALIVTGPGVTNVATAVGEAFADSSPMLVIATNLERKYIDTLAGNLHEMTDQMAVMRPIVKWAKRVEAAADIPAVIAEAFAALATGRPRPVYVEIPIDVLAEDVDVSGYTVLETSPATPTPDDIAKAAALIAEAHKVCIFAGGGTNDAVAAELLTQLAEELGAGVVTSLMGKGSIPEDHPNAVGAFGYRWAADSPTADLMRGSDLTLAIGTGLGVRTTAEATLPLSTRLLHVDIDASELGAHYSPTLAIAADATETLTLLLEAVRSGARPRGRWDAEDLAAIRERQAQPVDARTAGYLPWLLALRAGLERDAILCNDMTMMAYEGVRYFPVYAPRSYTFPRGFGTLGSAMPTALGAKVAQPHRQVVSVAGDGGFQFTLEELGAAVHHRIPVTMVIFNDATHSAVKVVQRRDYERRYVSVDLVNPDYVKIAEAYGMPGRRIGSPAELTSALIEARESELPVLLDVPIRLETY
ncbi:MAG: acetolactate synthase [Chloroflexi bacterium]|nr:MAG: acetolactate synthase [Chloroflexota bacterium]